MSTRVVIALEINQSAAGVTFLFLFYMFVFTFVTLIKSFIAASDATMWPGVHL